MKRLLYMYRVLILGVFFLCTGVAIAQQSDWQVFRKAYPYHIQTIALSERNSEGHRTLILSEPPPSVTTAQIREIDPRLSEISTGSHGFGVDGWVKDVVIDLPPIEEADLKNLLDLLQQKLFGTTYKAYITPISGFQATTGHPELNLQVNSGDIAAWVLGKARPVSWGSVVLQFVLGIILLGVGMALFDGKRYILGLIATGFGLYEMFHQSAYLTLIVLGLVLFGMSVRRFQSQTKGRGTAWLLGAIILVVWGVSGLQAQKKDPATLFSSIFSDAPISVPDILTQHKNGVFISRNPGLVLLSFPKDTPLDHFQIEIREFLLDSDLILGAVSSGGQVAIIARERATSVAQLPPLRAETVLLLAGAKEDELAQSYERNNVLAGTLDDEERWDWAPIYLSPRLIDTEYGSLLNITDQLLKSWSMHGNVEYANFEYREPSSYPFEQDLMTVLNTHDLTFNWNTKGAGYVTRFGSYEVMALNRTGSLPIDYLAQGKPNVQEAENKAYKYYSSLSDPNLVRVVQYAALYQILHHFAITASVKEVDPPAPEYPPVAGDVRQALAGLVSISDEKLAEARRKGGGEFLDQVEKARDHLHAFLSARPSASLLETFVDVLISRDRQAELDALPDISERRALLALADEVSAVCSGGGVCAQRSVMRDAEISFESEGMQRNSRWIHTPTVVRSRQTLRLAKRLVGGHNLSSAVTVFEEDAELSRGKVVVTRDGSTNIVHYSPEDKAHIGSTVRDAARDDNMTTNQVESAVEESLKAEARPPVRLDQGLGFDDHFRPDKLRGLQAQYTPSSSHVLGFRRTEQALSDADAHLIKTFSKNDTRAVLVARDGNGGYIVSAPPAASIQAEDMASSVDAYLALNRQFSAENKVTLHLRGFDDRQSEGFVRNLEAHSDVHPTVISSEEVLDPAETLAAMERKYNFGKAKELSQAKLVTEQGRSYVEQSFSLPAREPGLKGLVIHIRGEIKRVSDLMDNLIAEFTSTVRSVFSNASLNDNIDLIMQRLNKELRANDNFHGAKARAEQQSHSIYWVDRGGFRVWAEDDGATG